MRYWVYKCNSRSMPYQVAHGDWDKAFESREPVRWGSTEWTRDLTKLAVGDLILAYQTDRNELVGLAKVKGFRKRGEYLDVILKPVKEIRAKVRPLKNRDVRIGAIPAFQPGPVKTIYAISTADAKALLDAATS